LKKKPAVPIEAGEKTKLTSKDKIRAIIKKAPKSKFLTASQETYWDILDQNEITICTGPAGTGKSYVAMKKAIDLLFGDNKFEKIIIVRPAVEAEEKIGLLPGDVASKMDPYVAPIFYILHKIIGKEATELLRECGFIEVHALAYLRGWSIDNAILVFEEAQNSTPNQLKLLLTRIGYNSKYFISGDLEQTDRYRDLRQSGLFDIKQRLQGVPKVGCFDFTNTDIVRNPIITEILKRYD
jgi:phosphate starvation-inducible PhoH-like protein